MPAAKQANASHIACISLKMFSRSVFRRKLTRILRVTKVAFEGATQRFDVDIGRIPGRGWNYNFHMSNIARWSIVINETLRLLNALTCRIFADELKVG